MQLRIVGGRLSGRRIRGPGKNTRPTAERVREAIFSALEARAAVEGARVLDLFSGTGALAFEALSRGAKHALCVDEDRRCIRAIRDGAGELSLTAELETLRLDLLGAPRAAVGKLQSRGPFDLILADPPYAELEGAMALIGAIAQAGIASPDALIVLEHASRDTPVVGPGLATVASYRYGDTAVAFLSAPEEPR